MKKILPILLILLGTGGGIGLGLKLRPPPTTHDEMVECTPAPETKELEFPTAEEQGVEYVKLNNQMIIPLIRNGNTHSLVVLTLNVEVTAGNKETIFKFEPKLRDAFLQVLFDHANVGGFDGDFTSTENMNSLKTALTETAKLSLGEIVHNVLISDIVRQKIQQ
ncbi:MAG: flagellar basal body-associated FliL family protein [Halocynthiibacter sp.]